MLEWLATALAACAILWTLAPLLRHDAWWIRAFEFPRVQAAVLTVLVLVLYLVSVGWQEALDVALLLALALCIGFQLLRIAPYTPLYPKQLRSAADPRPADTLQVIVANVLTPNRNAEALLAMIRARDPDIVLAVETDRWWESRLDALEPDYPHTLKHPLDNLYGMHLYSRLELIEPQVLCLVQDDVPSMHADVVLRSGHHVELHCLHPVPPSPTENWTSAERDAELLVVAREIEGRDRSVVVMGDMNDVAWSATTRLFQKLSGLLDPRIGRGMYSTFHARYPFLRWPLDHVFCSDDFELVSLTRLDDFGSDHFPIHVVLCHRSAAEALQEEPDAEDQARAEDKIEKVDTDEEALGDAMRRVRGTAPSTDVSRVP